MPPTVRDAVLARASRPLRRRRSRCSRPSPSPCRGPSPGCSRPLLGDAHRAPRRVHRERARHRGRRRRRLPPRARPCGRRGRDAADAPARLAAAHPRRLSRRRTRARSTRRGSRTTPRRQATSMRCSSSPSRPLRGRLDRGLPGGGRAVRARPQGRRGSALRRPARRAARGRARAPATWPTTSSRRSHVSARRSRAARQEGARAHEARDLTELSVVPRLPRAAGRGAGGNGRRRHGLIAGARGERRGGVRRGPPGR